MTTSARWQVADELDGLKLLLAVALGGALGAMARYGVGGWVQQLAGAGFPWGTLVVNIAGSFALGTTLGLLQGAAAGPEARAFLTIGVFGAFTTFSTFTWETVALLQDGEWGRAALYLSGSVVIGLLAVVAGLALADALAHGRVG